MSILTENSTVSQAVRDLKERSLTRPQLSTSERIRLCGESLRALDGVVEDWIRVGVQAKQCENNPKILAEELLTGPTVVARYLQLALQTLQAIDRETNIVNPRSIYRLGNGQLAVPVFPAKGLFDSLAFMGLRGSVRMKADVGINEIHGNLRDIAASGKIAGITAVLGAGNVSSIPATDSLNRIFFDCRLVILKMNPVNQYLAGIFQRAFAPLIEAGLLRIITGAEDVGRELIQHEGVTDVHVTGSICTHDAIVWGTDPDERDRRKRLNQPLLTKPISSELGNVSPWIIVPGAYSQRELQSQALHVAASITNNASFNCLTTRVIVTWDRWDQRSQFLDLVKHFLAQTPPRPAYYPGAVERYCRFAANGLGPDESNRLPWALLIDQSIDDRPELFREELFTCICAETALSAATPNEFLAGATEFVNDRIFGSLCASVTFPPDFRRTHPVDVEQCLQKLRYGSVCVNQWSGLAYALITPPWGAYPGSTLANTESGIGNVHNTYLLDQYEKAVLSGPLINFPKPVWFPNHRNSLWVARHLFALYRSPSVTKLPALFSAALMG